MTHNQIIIYDFYSLPNYGHKDRNKLFANAIYQDILTE